MLDTSFEPQHEFCALWNQVRSTDNFIIPWNILRPIRSIYLALHLHTNSAPTAFSASTSDEDRILLPASTYPRCNIPDHHSASTPQIHDVSTSITISQAVLHDPSSLVSAPDAPSSSLTTPVHTDDNTVDVPLLHNMLVPAPSSCAHQTATEHLHDYDTSPDPAAAAATRDSTSARTMPPTTHETSTSASVPPPAMISHQSNAGVHSDTLDILSLASSESVLDDHSTGPSLLTPRLSQSLIAQF